MLRVDVDRIPEAVQRLIRDQVRSYDALEVVLLLHGDPARTWRVADVAGMVRMSDDTAAAVLAELSRQQLVVEATGPGGRSYRLNVQQPDAAAAVDELAAAWENQRLALIRLLNANALERLRTGAARALSDAFLFTRRKNNG